MRPKNILVPVPPEGVLPGVLGLVSELQPAHVELMTVVAPRAWLDPHLLEVGDGLRDAEAATVVAVGHGRLRAAVEQLAGFNITEWVDEGYPAEAIVARARLSGADLIVMASHQRTGLPRQLIGSVTEAVLRRAPCPVLVVPPGEP